jgi:F-type H+-transporting ATPase subunit gamma
MLSNVATAAASLDDTSELPLLAVRDEKKIQLILVSSDSGLAGGFNANLFRVVRKFISDHKDADIGIEAVGRKGRDFFRRLGANLTGQRVGIVDKPKYEDAASIAHAMTKRYADGEIDALYLAVNEFKNVMAPDIVVRRILPIELPQTEEQHDYIFEESPAELLKKLLPLYVEFQMYRALLESNSAYNAARMTAMDAASKNAGDVIDTLTLNLNRVRQASITREIIEIVSGAAAQ